MNTALPNAHDHSAPVEPQGEPPEPLSPARPEDPPRELPFHFTGDAREYFSIWIVNLALTLATLGLFSAWAKVRQERYFYGNTWVDGVPFEYLAPPLAVLRGRLIAVALLIVYVVVSEAAPIASFALLAMLIVATPWIVVSGLRFRARYSAWRSLTFRFDGRTAQAYVPWFWLLLLVPLTLGLAIPFMRHRQRRFIVDHHAYADASFSMTAGVGEFVLIYVLASVFAVVAIALAAGIGAGVMAAIGTNTAVGIGVAVASYVAIFFVWVFVAVRTTNLVYNTSRYGEHRFRSTLAVPRVLWIYITNTLAVVGSVGLLIPWAQIRLARYRASQMVLLATGALDAFAGSTHVHQSATGAEAADVFDVDLSL